MAKNGKAQSYLAGLAGNRVARIAVLVTALIFIGGFWLLDSAGIIEPGQTVAIIGVAVFVIVAFPIAMVAGKMTDEKLGRR